LMYFDNYTGEIMKIESSEVDYSVGESGTLTIDTSDIEFSTGYFFWFGICTGTLVPDLRIFNEYEIRKYNATELRTYK